MRLKLKILDLMCRNLENGFTINQIAKNLDETYSFVNRIVNNLIKDNILITKKVGNAFLCSLNLKNNKTIALIHLNEVENKEEFYKNNKNMKLILENFLEKLKLIFKENLIFVVVFGSYAKSLSTKESDIDVLIVCRKKLEIIKLIREIYAKYGKEIVPVLMNETEFKKQKEKPIIKEIIKEHYILDGFENFIRFVYKDES